VSERKACVTGGAGFIGAFLSRRLWSEGWHVTVLDCCRQEDLGTPPCAMTSKTSPRTRR